jgi:hypothetical protein
MAFRTIVRAVRVVGRPRHDGLASTRSERVGCRDPLGVKERGVAAVPGLDPFSLAEPATVGRILAPAHSADSEFHDVDVPLHYG